MNRLAAVRTQIGLGLRFAGLGHGLVGTRTESPRSGGLRIKNGERFEHVDARATIWSDLHSVFAFRVRIPVFPVF